MAGHSYVPEAFVVLCRFAFEDLALHRLQASIIPRNGPSNRVAEKLGLRNEGIALRYLEINGVWEDHVRYAITSEDWAGAARRVPAGLDPAGRVNRPGPSAGRPGVARPAAGTLTGRDRGTTRSARPGRTGRSPGRPAGTGGAVRTGGCRCWPPRCRLAPRRTTGSRRAPA